MSTQAQLRNTFSKYLVALILEKSSKFVPSLLGDKGVSFESAIELINQNTPHIEFNSSNVLGVTLDRLYHEVVPLPPGSSALERFAVAIQDDTQAQQAIDQTAYMLAMNMRSLHNVLTTKTSQACESLHQAIQRDMNSLEASPALPTITAQMFNWGVLSNGIIDHTIRTVCLDKAGVFENDQIQRHHLDKCLGQARRFPLTTLNDHELDLLKTLATEHLEDRADAIVSLLTEPVIATRFVNDRISNLMTMNRVVDTTEMLSSYYVDVNLMAQRFAEQELQSDAVTQNLQNTKTMLSLLLGGVLILKDTKFKNSLILSYQSDKDEPVMMLNNDMVEPSGISVETLSHVVYHHCNHQKIKLPNVGLDVDMVTKLGPIADAWAQKYCETHAQKQDRDDTVALRRIVTKVMTPWILAQRDLKSEDQLSARDQLQLTDLVKGIVKKPDAIYDQLMAYVVNAYGVADLVKVNELMKVAYENLGDNHIQTAHQSVYMEWALNKLAQAPYVK